MPDKSKKHTLYSGTKVIQTRSTDDSPVLALVTRTGFVTTKGALIRGILYPRPIKFKFYEESYWFVAAMALVAILGFAITLPMLMKHNGSALVLIDKSLDLITVTVPPALPATMSAGVAFAVSRLKRQQIYCISPPRVNLSGRVQTFVFDKTGTLTEDGLRTLGIRAINDGGPLAFTEIEDKTAKLPVGDKVSLLTQVMASCHAITYVEEDLIGDPLEIEMFYTTGWELDESVQQANALETDAVVLAYARPQPPSAGGVEFASYDPAHTSQEIAIVRRFDFESKLARMSIVAKNMGTQRFWSFVKGSPEGILALCKKQSIPADFDQVLNEYTAKGHRVIAFGARELDETVSYVDC